MAKYAYYIDLPWLQASQFLATEFDPASVAKLFYATYLFSSYRYQELAKINLKLRRADLQSYAYGTRKLSWRNIGQQFSLIDLLTTSLQDSCNVATGILADFCKREKVNDFIRTKLGLTNTSVPSEGAKNLTTVSDLVKLLKVIADTDLLEDPEREYLLKIMQQTSRRAVIKNTLPGNQVFSKGGTTFTGARRDLAIIKIEEKFYFVVVVQLEESKPSFTRLDKALAKLHRGRLSEFLKRQDKEFGQFVAELLGSP